MSKLKAIEISPMSPTHKEHLLVSKDGYSFDRNSNRWVLNKDVTISFQVDILALDEKVLQSFRFTLARYAEELSAGHTSNMYIKFQRLIRDTNCNELNVNAILNWKAFLGKDREWCLGALRGFLISWFDYRQYGVTADVVELLESLRLSGAVKGVAVANRCPYSGAFTENEMLAIMGELIELWSTEQITFPCYAYVSLVQATARRTIQLRQLKACDLLKESKYGVVEYYLNIPRAKQRNVGFRGAFKKLSITEDLYLIILNLIVFQKHKIESTFSIKLTAKQEELTPLFVDMDMCEELHSQLQLIDNSLFESDILHSSSTDLRRFYMKKFNVKQKAISERTGDIIHITSRRFRHTRGTNLGRKGIGANIIAEALDHSDSQNVKVYAENTAETVQFIDKAIGRQLAPFANAFLGRIIENLDGGERGDDKTANIPNEKNEAIGACGTNDFCVNGFESCYVCRKFRPLLDAPHADVLESLYKEKEDKLKKTGSIQFASTKDRLILAVEQVVQQCNEIKLARGEI
jgi:integrase